MVIRSHSSLSSRGSVEVQIRILCTDYMLDVFLRVSKAKRAREPAEWNKVEDSRRNRTKDKLASRLGVWTFVFRPHIAEKID